MHCGGEQLGQNRGRGHRILTPKKTFLLFGLPTSVQNFSKIEQKARTDRQLQVLSVSATVSDCRSLLESPRYTSCEFAMVECRRFDVGILMLCVIVSEILLLPVSWLLTVGARTERQTDRQTEGRKRFYNLSHAICYSNGADNNALNSSV